jgi:ATP-dependent helicase HrpB
LARSLPQLPIDSALGEIVAALSRQSSLVLRAPPGAGKTTRVPAALLDSGLAGEGSIVVLQPRRVAARAAAARVAYERGSSLGEEIGYQVRFESRVSGRTRLVMMTEGILLRRLLDDPLLPDIAIVIFDEFHERSLASDLALAMVRQIQQAVRPELKIIVMSATLSTEPIAKFLGSCPTIESAGRTFPVAIEFAPHLERRQLIDLVAEGVESIFDRTAGDCLVFLPGVGEIRQCEKRLSPFCQSRDVALLQLYGDLPADKQDEVLQPLSRRKVILATNVAETSLTIEGVTSVVDSGLARVLRYDQRTGLDRLELSPISRASADQRAGRAGRTQPGVCLRLWPEASHRSRPEFELPEIRRVDLAGAVLQVLCWIEPDLANFGWFEPPPPGAVDLALKLLERLGASGLGGVTPLGRQLASLPAHPRIGRLLLEGARLGVLHEVALAAALLSERSPFIRPNPQDAGRRGPKTRSRSDVLDRVHAIERFEDQGIRDTPFGAVNTPAARQILRSRDQLMKQVPRALAGATETPADSDSAFLRSLLTTYLDRVARLREKNGRRGVMVGGRGVRLADEVALVDEELFVCVELDDAGGEVLVRQASAVDQSWLPPDFVITKTIVEFDDASEKVVARRQTAYEDLVLEESQAALPDKEDVAQVLVAAVTDRLTHVFPHDNPDVAGFLARAHCLRSWMPDLDLPPLDNQQLQSLLPQLAFGRRSLQELRQAPWLDAIKSLFGWQQLQALDREAPERIQVPSGSHIALQYEPGRPPILAVRIQEVFGLLQTPRIAGGRISVLMHLLAPNMRVAQVTDDLESFWARTYAQVRKDLRARYPKHSWPEDPYTATAQKRPARKK